MGDSEVDVYMWNVSKAELFHYKTHDNGSISAEGARAPFWTAAANWAYA